MRAGYATEPLAHQVALLEGGRELFPELLQAIDAAAHTVWLETYIFSFDACGERIADALARAAGRGVAVHLAVDGFGTPAVPPPWARRFTESGVRWHVFAPPGLFAFLKPRLWRRLHRKLCVVDGRVGFCGGINILDDYLDPGVGRLTQPRLDFAVKVVGARVHDIEQAMARLWWRMTVAHDLRDHELQAAWRQVQQQWGRTLGPRSRQTATAADAMQPVRGSIAASASRVELVLRDNLLHRRRIERAYLKAIGAARGEVIIANAYFLPGARLRKALIHACGRGVRVRLLLQGRYEYFLQFYASRPVYGALLAAGVEIHEYEASFLHAKVAVIDERWATVGSSNLDPLSLLLAREANIVVRDRDFAAGLRRRLEAAMAHGGRRVDAVAFDRRPWRQRLLEWLAFCAMRAALLLVGRRY